MKVKLLLTDARVAAPGEPHFRPDGRRRSEREIGLPSLPASRWRSPRESAVWRKAKAVAAAVEGMARNPGAAGAIRFALILGLALIESLALYTLVDYLRSRSHRMAGTRRAGHRRPLAGTHETPRHLPADRHAVRPQRRSVPSQGQAQRREVEPHGALRLRGLRLHRRERHAHDRGEDSRLLGVGGRVRRAGETADRRHGRGKRARDRLAHQPRGGDRLQGRHGAHAALLQEPVQQRTKRRRSTSARWRINPRSRS